MAYSVLCCWSPSSSTSGRLKLQSNGEGVPDPGRWIAGESMPTRLHAAKRTSGRQPMAQNEPFRRTRAVVSPLSLAPTMTPTLVLPDDVVVMRLLVLSQ